MLTTKHHRGTLKEPELVLARELSKGNHRTTEGDGTNGCTQEKFKPITHRNGLTLGCNVQCIGLGHGGNSNKHS